MGISSDALKRLVLINIVVSLIAMLMSWLGGRGLIAFDLSSWLTLPAGFRNFAMRPWTLLSYMFCQFNVIHLLMNMLWLVWFGMMAIRWMGEQALVRSYIWGGLIGGISYLIANQLPEIAAGEYLCGASASVLAIMSALLLIVWRYDRNATLRLYLFGDVQVRWIVIVGIALTFIGSGGAGSSIAAHVGGVIGGAILGLVYILKRDRFAELKSWVVRHEAQVRREKHRRRMEAQMSDRENRERLVAKMRLSGYASLSDGEKRALTENEDKNEEK